MLDYYMRVPSDLISMLSHNKRFIKSKERLYSIVFSDSKTFTSYIICC